jgi:phage shock protein A
MADSLKARVGRVVAGSVHALLDQIEGLAPEAMMDQAIREADKVVEEVRHELGRVAANLHLAQQQHATLNRQHETLVAQIEEALVGQRDDLARAAVARQLDIEAQLPVLESTLADLSGQEAELRSYVEALLAKRREMEHALSQFRRSRSVAAAAASAPTTDQHGARMSAATAAFDRVFERETGLTATAHGATLEQAAQLKQLEDLARHHKIDERLAQLKAARS